MVISQIQTLFSRIGEQADTRESIECGAYSYALEDDGSACITRCRATDVNLTVPRELDGHRVSRIGKLSFFLCNSVTELTIPDTVTRIDSLACFCCIALRKVTLPDTALELGMNPFAYCAKLKTITICADHPTLALTNGMLFERATASLICCPCGIARGKVTVPMGTKKIGGFAFFFCAELLGTVLPDGITEIGGYAFSNCPTLGNINLPASAETLGENIFSDHGPDLMVKVSADSAAHKYVKACGVRARAV